MEERLFWIGIAMGLYAWGTRWGTAKGWLDSRGRTTLWHAAFCAIAGFAATLVGVMSIESRGRYGAASVGPLSLQELYLSLAGAGVLALWGAASAYRGGRSIDGRKHFQSEDMEWAETVFSAVLLASVLMYFVVQAFKIPSGSMRSTLLEGDHLFVNKFIYGVRIPLTRTRVLRFSRVHRGDIVVFQFPTESKDELHCGAPQYGKDFIKRAIGLPGDTVEVRAGQVYVNGQRFEDSRFAQYLDVSRIPPPVQAPAPAEYQELWQSHQLDHVMGDSIRDYFGPVKVPEHEYLMMGDNRDRSCDSRFWGPVEDYYIKGKAWVLYWPPSRMGLVH